MASARQIELARLVAAGVPGPEAMEAAGWPRSTASWLGLNVDEYLRKAGLAPTLTASEAPEAVAPLFVDTAAPKARGRKAAATEEGTEV